MLVPVLVIVLLVHVPLAQALVPGPAWKRARLAAVIPAVVALCLPPGDLAATLALPWLGYTGVLALWSLRSAARDLKLLATLYLPVGAVWLVFSRYGQAPLGFTEPIVTLTAMHFHVAGFAAMVAVAEMCERAGGGRLFTAAALGAGFGMPLVALGITYSKAIEVVAVAVFATSLLVIAVLGIGARGPIFGDKAGLGAFALLCLAVAMVLALWYGVGPVLAIAPPSIPWMAATHGFLNVFGFTWPALWALRHPQG